MTCTSCGASIDTDDRYCPACRLPNLRCARHPRFGPPERDPGPIVEPRVTARGERACPRCVGGIHPGDRYCRSCGLDVSRLPVSTSGSHTVGVWTTPGPLGTPAYVRLGPATISVRVMMAAVASVGVLLVGLSLVVWRTLGGSVPVLDLPAAKVDWVLVQTWARGLAVLQAGLLLMATVLMVRWTARAYRNLEGLQVQGLRLSARWGTLAWLIPGVNLFLPKLLIDDTWRASDPLGSAGWKRWRLLQVPTPHHLWWLCSLTAMPLAAISMVQLFTLGGSVPVDPVDVHSTQTVFVLLALAEILLAFAAVLFDRMLCTITERQRDRAEALGPPPMVARLAAASKPVARPVPAAPAWVRRRGGRAPATEAAAEPEAVLVHAMGDQLAGRY